MKRKSSLLCFAALFAVAALTGCESGPDHRKADFSPNGMMVAVITNDMQKDHFTSAIAIRRADSKNPRASTIYKAPPKMEIYDVFWKNDRMIVFESGESLACPGAEKLESANAKEEVPRFDIRIVALEGTFTGWLRSAKSRELFKASYACWKDVIKTEKGWRRNLDEDKNQDDRNNILEMTNISNARDADLIVFEPLGERGANQQTGLILINTKTGEMTPILEGRKVSSPSISWDGRKVAFIEETGTAEKRATVMRIANLAGGAESEVMMIADLKDERPMWSKDGKYLFIPGMANVAYTTECDRKYVESEFKRMHAEEEKKKEEERRSSEEISREIYTNEAAEKGHCKSYRGLVSENDRDPLKAYREGATTWYSLHKYYPDMGIAVKLMDQVNYFSINPETQQILVSRLQTPINEKEGLWLVDYSGREIRQVAYQYIEEFDAVNKYGMAVGAVADNSGSVPVILDSTTDKERPLIGKKQDLLTLANYNFDKGQYGKAKTYFEQYASKFGLPEDSDYRLLMIATYRETKDFEKMMRLTRTVPVEEIQRYFAASGKI